ncbi:MAG: PAS domain-containing sensor histidine kinase [Thermodesulfovibrionales bacterium]
MGYEELFERLASIGMPAMCQDRWHGLSFSDCFHITEGRDILEEMLRERVPEDLSLFLDDSSFCSLRDLACSLGHGAPGAGVYCTRAGRSLEMVVVRTDAPFKALWRDIDGFVRSTERLAIFYKNYLHTPTAICFTDAQGNIVDANRSFQELYGYALDEIIGSNPKILKSGRQSPLAYKALWESITNKDIGSWTGELINRKKNGEEIYVLLTISSVLRPDGSLIGYVASTLDISKRKKMELELEERNRELETLNRFKSDMMAITSHDLKAPLNAMISYADLIRENLASMPQPKMADYLTKISEYGQHLTKFIGELLDLTKIEAGRFQLVTNRARLDSVLQGCIEINQAHSMSKGVRVRLYREGKNRTAVVDVMRMAQVFNNILSNGVKFSPDGGEITVIYSDEGQRTLKITIDDQGAGIPEEDLQAIFNQYYQVLKDGHAAKRAFGAGIGLSVVKTIIELHGGTVSVENLSKKGCRFVIEIPIKTFTSLRGLAVMCYDPRQEIFGYIEPPARTAGIDFFTALNMREIQRIVEYDNPDVIFVSASGLSDDIVSFLMTKRDEGDRLYIIKVQDADSPEIPEDDLFFRTLVTPVSDIEINDILKDIFQEKQRGI